MAMTDSGDEDRLAIAARWRVALDENGHAEDLARRFQAWRTQDPANAAAFDRIEQGLAALDATADDPVLARFRAEAREAAFQPRRIWIPVAASIALLTLAVPAYIHLMPAIDRGEAAGEAAGERIETAIGQQRTVRLDDGSRVTIDGGSTLAVRFDTAVRRIEVIAGQARFQVAHGDPRPFKVATGNHEVIAVGTDFNVDRLGRTFTVSLISGRVLVQRNCRKDRGDCASTRQRLEPGEALSGTDGRSPLTRSRITAEEALAWQRGQIVIRDQPLAQIAQRINRHNGHVRLLVTPSAADLTLSGVFSLSNPSEFAEAAAGLLPIETAQTANGDILLRARAVS